MFLVTNEYHNRPKHSEYLKACICITHLANGPFWNIKDLALRTNKSTWYFHLDQRIPQITITKLDKHDSFKNLDQNFLRETNHISNGKILFFENSQTLWSRSKLREPLYSTHPSPSLAWWYWQQSCNKFISQTERS